MSPRLQKIRRSWSDESLLSLPGVAKALKADASLTADDVFLCAVNADPTPTGKYVSWLLKSWENHGFLYEDICSGSDSDIHDVLKSMMICHGVNIMQFRTPGEIFRFIGGIKVSGKQKKGNEQSRAMNESMSFTAGDVSAYIPFTRRASQFLGWGTRWCTASRKHGNAFDAYADYGFLIIFEIPDPENACVRKFQMFIPSSFDYGYTCVFLNDADDEPDEAERRLILNNRKEIWDIIHKLERPGTDKKTKAFNSLMIAECEKLFDAMKEKKRKPKPQPQPQKSAYTNIMAKNADSKVLAEIASVVDSMKPDIEACGLQIEKPSGEKGTIVIRGVVTSQEQFDAIFNLANSMYLDEITRIDDESISVVDGVKFSIFYDDPKKYSFSKSLHTFGKTVGRKYNRISFGHYFAWFVYGLMASAHTEEIHRSRLGAFMALYIVLYMEEYFDGDIEKALSMMLRLYGGSLKNQISALHSVIASSFYRPGSERFWKPAIAKYMMKHYEIDPIIRTQLLYDLLDYSDSDVFRDIVNSLKVTEIDGQVCERPTEDMLVFVGNMFQRGGAKNADKLYRMVKAYPEFDPEVILQSMSAEAVVDLISDNNCGVCQFLPSVVDFISRVPDDQKREAFLDMLDMFNAPGNIIQSGATNFMRHGYPSEDIIHAMVRSAFSGVEIMEYNPAISKIMQNITVQDMKNKEFIDEIDRQAMDMAEKRITRFQKAWNTLPQVTDVAMETYRRLREERHDVLMKAFNI